MAEPVYVRARVIGAMPIRDAVTRESVEEGGIVRLLPRETGVKPARCARHPKRGVHLQTNACTCGGTLIDALITGGSIELIDAEPAKVSKAKS